MQPRPHQQRTNERTYESMTQGSFERTAFSSHSYGLAESAIDSICYSDIRTQQGQAGRRRQSASNHEFPAALIYLSHRRHSFSLRVSFSASLIIIGSSRMKSECSKIVKSFSAKVERTKEQRCCQCCCIRRRKTLDDHHQ